MLVTFADVRRAVDDGAIVPCFQPIVELRTGRLVGFEVLARWDHPDHGLILPENFISLAEENGLSGLLTQQILRKSFMVAPSLPEPLFLAVNISPVQLSDLDLTRLIREAADDAGFPLQRLVVEITETALVNNLECAREIALELKAMECRLALDDFGTGYSSLTHLQALPFSELKVDRSFVHSMTYDRGSRKIVAAVLGLGYSLDMITVAEGVETTEQANMLVWLGCELGQGWLFGGPRSAACIPDMIAAAPWQMSDQSSALGDGITVSDLEALPAQRLAQLQAIYDGAPVGLCFIDKHLRYISLNRRLADMNGAPIEAHVGRTVGEMIPAYLPIVEPYLRRALDGEAIPKVEVPRPASRLGQIDRRVMVSYQPIWDEVGDVIGISIAVLDVTEL